MFYTIIARSGWAGDPWRIVKTMTNKRNAHGEARNLMQNNPRYTNYQMDVKAHHKELIDMVNLDNFLVKFSDGTQALDDMEKYYE